jgi:hypothetical protein
MPEPITGETRSEYMSRCVRELKQEDPNKPMKECLGKCFGLWRTYTKQQDEKEKPKK